MTFENNMESKEIVFLKATEQHRKTYKCYSCKEIKELKKSLKDLREKPIE